MSGDPQDPKLNPRADDGPNQPNQASSERPDQRFESRSGFRPGQPAPRPAESSAPRPAPWDLTTRVPVATARHVNPEDLTLFAMQLLTQEEAAPIIQHVETCADCRRELSQIRTDLGAYAFSVDMHEPSAATRESLMRKVAREKKAIPISHSRSAANIATFGRTTSILVSDEAEIARPNRTPKILAWTGWAAAAALAVTAGVIYKDREGLRQASFTQASQIIHLAAEAGQAHRLMDAIIDPHAQRVTLTTKPLPPAPIGRATYNADKGTLVFLASDMEQLKPDKTYELWLIPADGTASLPAGTFHPDDAGNASVILPTLPKGVPAKGFGITVENEGGSDTPTKPIIMVGF
ncbi:MAG: hypothetical protein NVSMB62_13040 [Acidobacteriaceae bacterium]